MNSEYYPLSTLARKIGSPGQIWTADPYIISVVL
jgi:hypothetical protein